MRDQPAGNKGPPPVRPANEFVKDVRATLGVTQEQLADRIGVKDRSTVGKWEMDGGDEPSWPFVWRMLVLVGVATKTLRNVAEDADSKPMNTIEARLLEELRKLPDAKKLDILIQVADEAKRHHASQPPAALKKG